MKAATDKVYNDFTVVLEDLHGKFDAFGEQLYFVNDEVGSLVERIDRIEHTVDQAAADMSVVKHELRLVRNELTKKVSGKGLQVLERRVAKLERAMAR